MVQGNPAWLRVLVMIRIWRFCLSIYKTFVGEGSVTPKVLKEWIMSMDDYFCLSWVQYVDSKKQGERLSWRESARLGWKCIVRLEAGLGNSRGWNKLKDRLVEHYLLEWVLVLWKWGRELMRSLWNSQDTHLWWKKNWDGIEMWWDWKVNWQESQCT